jgi:hypothetical protein
MALVTRNDVEQYTGFKYTEFTENGLEMNEGQWVEFIDMLIPKITQMIHRFCNVYSFEKAAFTEYHSGKGAQNYDTNQSDYNEEDTQFFLHHLYESGIAISEQTSTKGNPIVWTPRTLITASATGDYEIYVENDVSWVQFYQNVPMQGTRNVKFAYFTGYADGSPELNDIKFQCLRAIKNVLLTKKKIQEASTIRNYGVRDYSQMFDAFSEGVVLDDKVKTGLEQYRRAVIHGSYAYS